MWIAFKYERLSSFCLVCGRITHTMGTCVDDNHPYQFALGEEMRGMVPIDDSGSLRAENIGMRRGNLRGRGRAPIGGRGWTGFSSRSRRSKGCSLVEGQAGNMEDNLGLRRREPMVNCVLVHLDQVKVV